MFEITEPTDATLVSITNREENHGEDKVPAISLRVKLRGPNTMLDWLEKTLRPALYTKVKGQQPIEGVEITSPNLRTKCMEHIALVAKYEGWTLHVDHGIDESEPVTFGGCKVDAFRVLPMEGGTVEITFRIGTNDISAESLGIIGMKLGQTISITLDAPKTQEKEKPSDGKPSLPGEWPFPGKFDGVGAQATGTPL
jgi:hypothetical protein